MKELASRVEKLRREIHVITARHEKGSAMRKRKVLRLSVHEREAARAEFAEFTRAMIRWKQTTRVMLSLAVDELKTALDAVQA